MAQDDALLRLQQQSMQSKPGGSLLDKVKARRRNRKSFMLLDYSGSMGDPLDGKWSITSFTRKADALQAIVKGLNDQGINLPMVGFGGFATHGGIKFVTAVPEPEGMTPLAEGIEFCTREHAEHLIVISDGEPDDKRAALKAGEDFGGPIDVFYVGPDGGPGAAFLALLCNTTGGQYAPADLAETKQLETKIRGLLGA